MRVKLLSMAATGRGIVLCAWAAQLSWGSGGLLSGGRGGLGRTSIQGLLLIENKVLHLSRHL